MAPCLRRGSVVGADPVARRARARIRVSVSGLTRKPMEGGPDADFTYLGGTR